MIWYDSDLPWQRDDVLTTENLQMVCDISWLCIFAHLTSSLTEADHFFTTK